MARRAELVAFAVEYYADVVLLSETHSPDGLQKEILPPSRHLLEA